MIVALFDELAAMGVLQVVLTGGEIGLRHDLFGLVAEARKRRFSVKLLSSGNSWEYSDLDHIANMGVRCVRLSVYSMSAKVHDAITRRVGSHDKTCRVICGLRERSVAVEIAIPVLALNAREVGQVVAFAKEVNAQPIVDFNLSPQEGGQLLARGLYPTFADYVELFRNQEIKHLALHSFGDNNPQTTRARSSRPCAVGEDSPFVRSNGEVLPCVNWPVAAGNLSTAPFRKIFRDSPVFTGCRALRNADLGPCLSCSTRGCCRPCPAQALMVNGHTSMPDTNICRTSTALHTIMSTHKRRSRNTATEVAAAESF